MDVSRVIYIVISVVIFLLLIPIISSLTPTTTKVITYNDEYTFTATANNGSDDFDHIYFKGFIAYHFTNVDTDYISLSRTCGGGIDIYYAFIGSGSTILYTIEPDTIVLRYSFITGLLIDQTNSFSFTYPCTITLTVVKLPI